MNGWVEAGVASTTDLPHDRLIEVEQSELDRLLSARERLMEQLHLVEQRVELFLLSVRDRRGLQGVVQVHQKSGRVQIKEDPTHGHG